MQTALLPEFRQSVQGREAEAILRSCVHCGFCTAACPTYQILGDERDSPRGRIYLIKQLLEGTEVGEGTQRHLDRCLTCRACETACPSGVQYGQLLDTGRQVLEMRQSRPLLARLKRRLLRAVLPYANRFSPLLRTAQWLRPILPTALRVKVPGRRRAAVWPAVRHARKMVILEGCVQPALTPATNAAAAQVLDRLGVSLIRAATAGCCGALSHHLSAHDEALAFARRNIESWRPHLKAGAEAVVMTASGCGVMVRDYGRLLAHDPVYAEDARRISDITRDLSEILTVDDVAALVDRGGGETVAFHAPCTLQHGQRIEGAVERLLSAAGYVLVPVSDGHLCCGAAGTYSLLQPDLSQQLRDNKLKALKERDPGCIATANVGCQLHLQEGAGRPVRHWIELLADRL